MNLWVNEFICHKEAVFKTLNTEIKFETKMQINICRNNSFSKTQSTRD